MSGTKSNKLVFRDLQTQVTDSMKFYPVVTITGPRQAGKTTLAKMAAPSLPYVNLENPKERELAQTDPEAFFARYSEGAIIDEIQRVPELTSWIQTIVDSKKKNGLFLLTGSHNFSLMELLTQSLAGRTAVLHLLPFSLNEYMQLESPLSTDNLIWKGFYPRIILESIPPVRGYADYVETYIERDVRQIIAIKNLTIFRRFLTLCAGRVGQILNKAGLSSDLGIDEKTVENWLSVLEASWIVFRIPPWSMSTTKRLTKSPKLYFYDVGLAAFLIGIERSEHINAHPLRGNLFENLVVAELLKTRFNLGLRTNLFFYRDSSHNEVDILVEKAGRVELIEVKSAMTWSASFANALNKVRSFLGELALSSWVIYDGSDSLSLDSGNMQVIPILQLPAQATRIVTSRWH